MEYHCTKAADVATKIFEIGLKQFAENIEYVVRYLSFLISINDDNSTFSGALRVLPLPDHSSLFIRCPCLV